MRKQILIGVIILLVTLVVATGCSEKPSEGEDGQKQILEVKLYKSESCGCCGLYNTYLQNQDVAVDLEQMMDITPIKDKLGIPANLRSCHTVEVDGYFVEGHVPKEAIDKLLTDRPADVIGIAIPGMPAGSPGMPGAKNGPFVIYAVHKDGSQTEFMRM